VPNRDRKFIFVFLALFLLAPACGVSPPNDALVVGLEGDPTNLDPRFSMDAYSSRIRPLLFDSLVEMGADGTLQPNLAESWSTEDGLTYTFRLKPGVKFHDGSALTSRDVKYTFDYLRDPKNGCPSASSLEQIASIETPDEQTVVFTLKEIFAPALLKLVKGIVPAHLGDDEDFGDKLIGSGPFALSNLRRGERIELVANKAYHGGTPSIGKLRFDVVRSDTTRMLRLEKGELHLVQNAVPPYATKFFERMDHLAVDRGLGVNYSYIGFNLKDPRQITSKLQVRRAIAHAVDRNRIIQALLKGQARPANGLLAPAIWAYEPNARTYEYDPDKARRLLDEAGFPDPDGDGPLPRFTLSYKTSTNKLRNRIADVLAAQLREVGIAVDKRSFEWGTFFDDIKKGNFQSFTLSWVGVTDPDIYHYIFHSENQPPKGANRGRYENPEVDALLDRTRTQTDEGERTGLFRQVQRILAEDCVYVSLWWADNVVVYDQRLKGFEVKLGGEYTSLATATWEQ
jgi:peptide/nickel transport system substrate-binding protein